MSVDGAVINDYLQKDLDTLLCNLGKELDHVSDAAYGRSTVYLIDIAREWLRENTGKLRKRICTMSSRTLL